MSDDLLSKHLRLQYDDLRELYNDAKLQENAPLMEKLAKSIASLAKQIKEHEIHELETLKRDYAMTLAGLLGDAASKGIKKYFPDDDRSNLVIDHLYDILQTMADDRELI